MNGPSTHLTWEELACKDGTPYPEEFKLDGRVFILALVFEDIRAIYRKPIIILSAFRTTTWNAKVGGAKFSQHIQGRALDLKPPFNVDVNKFYKDIKDNADCFGIHGLGKYLTFVHVDIRPIDNLVTWNGPGVVNII